MRKYLTSTTAVMVIVLVVLVAIGVWLIVTTEGDEQDVEPSADVTQAEEDPAVGGGPEAAPQEDEEAVEEETAPQLEQPQLDEPQLEQPDLEDGTAPESMEAPGDDEQAAPEPPAPPEVDEDDQEAAYRADEAPEAEILGVEPPDASNQEGGGPVDEQQASDEEELQDEEAMDEERTQPQRVEDLMKQLDREEGRAVPDQQQQRAPAPPPPEESPQDEPLIERPSLRTAPAPSRPGED